MRFPDIERDTWELRAAEAAHQAHSSTFWIPPLEARQNLKRGQAAKLIFDIESEDEHGEIIVHGERMWVIVAEQVNKDYIGILDNQPASIEVADDVYLCFGAEIPFRAEHIIDIANPSGIRGMATISGARASLAPGMIMVVASASRCRPNRHFR